MDQFTPDAAVKLVRNNLDELDMNGSAMYDTDNDNNSLDNTIKRHLPEAINAVHMAAPTRLLEGENATDKIEGLGYNRLAEGVWSYDFAIDDPAYLRLVAMASSANPLYVVTEVQPMGGVSSRKQLNPYIRGRYDRPRLVQYPPNGTPEFCFYSFKSQNDKISSLFIIRRQDYDASATGYNYSPRLKQNIVDCLTAKVLETFGDQRAQSFYQRAYTFPTI